jgi:hypothetical protein
MVMLGDHGVPESLVEAEIAGKLAAYADADLNESLGVGIVVRPAHEGSPDALALSGGIDCDSPDMEDADLAVEAQAADGVAMEQRHDPA